MEKISLKVNTQNRVKRLGDLFGIFFEDINYAADGGLYAECVRNGSFEFCYLDNPEFCGLTGWEKVKEGQMEIYLEVRNSSPAYAQNPDYLQINTRGEGRGGIRNSGYDGMFLLKGNVYQFTCYARKRGGEIDHVMVCLEDENSVTIDSKKIRLSGDGWIKYECTLCPQKETAKGCVSLILDQAGFLDVDMVSLMPENVFESSDGKFRKDIAQLISDLKPRFMRFPGGCLVPVGTLDQNARDSAYCWKNTIGPIEERGARRNTWGYNQSFGIGYYEYFVFCEKIGAEPIPVLPAGNRGAVCCPPDETQRWVDDALDLIEFANGTPDSHWGAMRAKLGHPLPFGLKYIAIGNEEVGETFFRQYLCFHQAIREFYPEIKIINSGSPFADGAEYERGWASARENGSDLVDEHYYQSPAWFLANVDRYQNFDPCGPQVFVGEYASKSNTWGSALAEAAYMTGLEKSKAVALACYAPLLCHAKHVQWKPDLIWFDNKQAFGTANYYVQKLFMNHLGDWEVQASTGKEEPAYTVDSPITGSIFLDSKRGTCRFSQIRLLDADGKEVVAKEECQAVTEQMVLVANDLKLEEYTLTMKAKKTAVETDDVSAGRNTFNILFGYQDEANYLSWELGGWGNIDSVISSTVNGRSATLYQSMFQVDLHREYDLRLEIKGREIKAYIDNELCNAAVDKIPELKSLYYAASIEETTGDVLVKLVNVKKISVPAAVDLGSMQGGKAEWYCLSCSDLEAENSFEEPEKISPNVKEVALHGGQVDLVLSPQSVNVIRIHVGGMTN